MGTIQVKRGLQEGVEGLQLLSGEFAVALDSGNVYVGTQNGKTHINPKGGIAEAAEKLTTASKFSITGDGAASEISFDGTGDVALALQLAVMPGLSAGTYTKLTVDEKGRVTAAESIKLADLPTITADKIDAGTSAGKIVVVGTDGKIDSSIIPDLAINDIFECGSEVEMLALNAQKGDVCIRTDENKSYILADSPASDSDNWKWLRTPDCKIISVNGKTGAVTLTAEDVGAAPAAHTEAVATASQAGHIKVGSGLNIAVDGTLSVGDIDGGTF